MASWLKPIVQVGLDSLRDREHPMNRQIMLNIKVIGIHFCVVV